MAKILVIEDQPRVRELLVDILVSDGHEVLAAADGRVGLELYARQCPALVIIDLLIPGISGLELVARLCQVPGLKVIAVSGSGVTSLEAARRVGATVTLAKPFSVTQVLTAVRQLLGNGPAAGRLRPPPTSAS